MTRSVLLAYMMGKLPVATTTLRRDFGGAWIEPMQSLLELGLVTRFTPHNARYTSRYKFVAKPVVTSW